MSLCPCRGVHHPARHQLLLPSTLHTADVYSSVVGICPLCTGETLSFDSSCILILLGKELGGDGEPKPEP